MTAKPIHGRGRPALALIAAGALLVAAGVADGASASVYKCSGKLGLVYTDQPCKGGEQLDLHAGKADPEAVARLQAARDQLDRGAAARAAGARRAAARRDLAALSKRQADGTWDTPYDEGNAFPPYDYALPWYSAFATMHRPPRRQPPHRPVAARTFAPNPPFIVPRS
jgi:hypothetical protein